jgi:uncharacterized protein (DUF58 family)
VTWFFRLLYLPYRMISGFRYWGKRRFTQAGVGMVGAFFLTALLGPDTENNVAYQALGLVLGLLIAAGIFSWHFRVRFSARRMLPRFGTVGHPLAYSVELTNLSRRKQTGLSLLEELADPRPSSKQWLELMLADERDARSFRFKHRRRNNPFTMATLKEAAVPSLLPGQEVEVHVELTPLRRGLLCFSGLALARSDPLGLFRSFIRKPLPQTALILPKRYPLPPLALPGALKYQEGGVALASNVGQSDEFVALRDYRHGDPWRHIHWRSWAKAGKPVVKEFEDEFFVRHALVLDTFTGAPHSEVFEEAVSVAASFACAIQTQESLLDLLFVGPQSYCFTAGRGLAHTDQMLEILASVKECADQSFDVLEELVLNHVGCRAAGIREEAAGIGCAAVGVAGRAVGERQGC